MAEDYYSEEGEDVAQPVEEKVEQRDPESDESETALINDSLFPAECKVGDTYTIKVIAQHDGEKEISLVTKEKEEPEAQETMNDKIAKRAAMA